MRDTSQIWPGQLRRWRPDAVSSQWAGVVIMVVGFDPAGAPAKDGEYCEILECGKLVPLSVKTVLKFTDPVEGL